MPAGFVAKEEETNGEYLESFLYETYDSWRPVIFEAHAKLREIDPNYKIAQIKEKFGGLRYYYDSELRFDDPRRIRMEEIIHDAEEAIDRIESAAFDAADAAELADESAEPKS